MYGSRELRYIVRLGLLSVLVLALAACGGPMTVVSPTPTLPPPPTSTATPKPTSTPTPTPTPTETPTPTPTPDAALMIQEKYGLKYPPVFASRYEEFFKTADGEWDPRKPTGGLVVEIDPALDTPEEIKAKLLGMRFEFFVIGYSPEPIWDKGVLWNDGEPLSIEKMNYWNEMTTEGSPRYERYKSGRYREEDPPETLVSIYFLLADRGLGKILAYADRLVRLQNGVSGPIYWGYWPKYFSPDWGANFIFSTQPTEQGVLIQVVKILYIEDLEDGIAPVDAVLVAFFSGKEDRGVPEGFKYTPIEISGYSSLPDDASASKESWLLALRLAPLKTIRDTVKANFGVAPSFRSHILQMDKIESPGEQ